MAALTLGPTRNSPANVSEEERTQYLDDLQAQTTRTMIPAMIFLLLLALVGLFGNTLVLVVYRRHFKQTSTRIFIMAIAIFDLVTNVLAIPGEVYDMFHRWDFNQPHLCGFRLTLNAFTIVSSALLLVALAVTRYRKVCRPHGKQTSIKWAKILSAIITVAALLVAMPCAILNGRRTKRTPRPDIQGQACNIDDRYVRTIWPRLYMGAFIVGFLVCCTSLIVLYILIGIQAWRHSSINRVVTGSRSSTYSSVYKTASETMHNDEDEEAAKKQNAANKVRKIFSSLYRKNGKSDSETRFYVDMKTEVTLDKSSDSSEFDEEKTDNNIEMQTMEKTEAAGQNEPNVIQEESILRDNPQTNFTSEIQNYNTHVGVNSNENSHVTITDKEIDKDISCQRGDTSTKTNSSNTETHDGRQKNVNSDDKVCTTKPSRKTSRCTFNVPERKPNPFNVAKSKARSFSTASQASNKSRRPMTRTTIMLTAITAVYVIGFLPHLSLIFYRYSSSQSFRNLTSAGFTAYNLFLRFHFLNSASNAIIYNLCDKKFREHARKILKCSYQ